DDRADGAVPERVRQRGRQRPLVRLLPVRAGAAVRADGRSMMRRYLAVLAGVALVAAALVIAWPWRTPSLKLVAHFTRAVGVHEGSDVRVLGVKVGSVVSATPEGRTVRVELRYDAKQRIPAGAQAIIVPPSIVSDRYVQLTPAYSGGPTLPDGAD